MIPDLHSPYIMACPQQDVNLMTPHLLPYLFLGAGFTTDKMQIAISKPDLGPATVAMPFAENVSPDLDAARLRHYQWITKFNLWPNESVARYQIASDIPALSARCYPNTTGADLDLVTDYMGWVFVFDDCFDEGGSIGQLPLPQITAVIDRFRRVLQGLPDHGKDFPTLAAWRELVARLNKITTRAWQERHCAHWEAAFRGFQQEAFNRVNNITPMPEEYTLIRHGSGCVQPSFDMMEAASHFDLPAHVHLDPRFVQLREDADDVICMTNDIFSASKEWEEKGTTNIVFVLAQQENCSWREASELAHRIINEKLDSFQRLEPEFYASACFMELEPADQANARQFIQGLKNSTSGSHYWHVLSGRYL